MDDQEDDYYSIIEPLGYQQASCGYCGSQSDSKSYGAWAYNLSPKVYQNLIDQGWRRSGSFLYLPDRGHTCCPPYTIRCSASEFQPSRSQRQAVYRFKSFIEQDAQTSSTPQAKHSKVQFDLAKIFETTEKIVSKANISHPRLEIKLEPAAFSQEKFELYQKYQTTVHNDPPEKITKKSFERFLCTNPFKKNPLVACHARWILDDKLIAFSVLDILPSGISSVYLVWDPAYAKIGLGRITTLREIAWIQEWKGIKHGKRFDWYYLGYYIHSCPKMKYKAEYSPSYLLDPTSLHWQPLSKCISLLESSTCNVTAFISDGKQEEVLENAGLVQVLRQNGQVERLPAHINPKIQECAKRLGATLLNDILICD
ncbi:hypothetical protein O181_029282 [Austropuccinia psidii MF-1]|uniref:Arginyl-tRNA--protein transferase 1 n=1 Tax=Austropuccinia psidii MF-1 TaxID=1389203 RepID=A0A9Q3H3D7_9BASI|nr:hypothetical protein [Austropuccinia psidii MF-1]